MHRAQETRSHSEFTLEQSILRTLLYFDLFQYPLLPEEIFKFLGTNSIAPHGVDQALDKLTRAGRVHSYATLYGLRAEEGRAGRTMRGNHLAQRMQAFAHRRW